MKKLALVVGALLALTCSAWAQAVTGITCGSVYQLTTTGFSLTRIITGVAGRTINLCGWAANAGAAPGAFVIVQGTGTNCNVGQSPITPGVPITVGIFLGINGVYVDHQPFAFYSVPPLVDVCLNVIGAGPTQIMIYYSQ